MYGKKFMKRLIAVTMAMSVFFVGKNILASQTHDTDVTLTIEEMAYVLTIPSNTALATDGSTTALTNGLTVSDGKLALGRRLDITISSKNSWKLTNETATTNKEISYALYANETDVISNTQWSFTRDEANKANPGTTKQIYAAAKVNEIYTAEAGTYKDIITFTAEIHSSLYPIMTEDRTRTFIVETEGFTTWRQILQNAALSEIPTNVNPIIYTDSTTSKRYQPWDPTTNQALDIDKAYNATDGIYLKLLD